MATEANLHKRTSPSLDDPEKFDEKVEVASVDVSLADEALRLVGVERKEHFSDEYNRKLRRKLDLVIPPLCAAVYFTQFLDKTSLNYASIMGLPITGQNYNLVSMAFYLGFLAFEFPTVYISQKLRLAKYLGTSFGAFFALRFILGMCESCVAPILILIISMFYKRDEQGTRIAWFYVMNGLTQIFGGFVAYGISFYDGRLLAPYKIIYILLGGLAIVVGICVVIWLPDSPVHAKMLTQEEKIAALERVRDDQVGTENKKLKKEQVIEALLDIRTWLVILTTLLTSIPNGGISNFSNLIIKSFGYTSKQALILSTPGGLVHTGMTLFCGIWSDRKNERMIPIVFAVVPTIIGAGLLIGFNGTSQKGVLLFGIYLCSSFGSALSTVYAYNASNTSGHTKKSTINALTLTAFSLGNIIGTEIFQPKDAPAYIPGKIAIMSLLGGQLIISFVLRYINLYLNKQKRAKVALLKEQNGWTDADIRRERERHAFMDLTDKQNPYFVYTA
ncbi:hypothetical protein ONZ45_g14372 [Pleurotus djamor]|nr:hypothetical protein ONZ45_g14372 [Pleurotus djamor]